MARPRVVILRALGLGDLLTAVPALRALARAFPDHERVLAAPSALTPLVELIDCDGGPAVHRVVPARELELLAPELNDAELGVNLHGRGPQSHRVLLAARPSRRLWFAHAEVPQSAGAPAWRPGEHEVERWCRMLTEQGIAADGRELGLRAPAPRREDTTVLHPGAASASRRWPAERFAVVARRELEAGRRVLVTGSDDERELALAVARGAGAPDACVLAGRTDLAALARVISEAGRVVCGDTGAGHLATAFGTPSVVLFGPTPPAEWGPPPGLPRHRTLWAGSIGDPHGRSPDPGLLSITVEDVAGALGQLSAA